MKLINILLGAALFFIPLISFPATFNHFEYPKVIIFYFFGLFFLIILSIQSFKAKEQKILISPIIVSLILFLFFYSVSLANSINLSLSIFGFYPRIQDGFIFLIISLIFYSISAYLAYKNSFSDIREIFIYAGLAGVIQIGYGVFQHLLLTSGGGEVRVVGLEEHPIYFATTVMAVFFIFWLLSSTSQNKQKKFFWNMAILGSIITIVLSLTRSVWISVLVSSLAPLWILRVNRAINFKFKTVLFVFLIMGFLILTAREQILNRIIQTFTFDRQTNNLFIRVNELKVGVLIVKDHPILGTGPATTSLVFPRYKPISLNYTKEWDQTPDYIRNNYLNIASGSGLITLVLYLIFISLVIIFTFKIINKQKIHLEIIASSILLGGFIALLIQQFFYHQTVSSNLYFWTFAGILTGFILKQQSIKAVVIKQPYLKILGVLVLAISIGALVGLSRLFIADLTFVKGLNYFNKLALEPDKKEVFLFLKNNFSSNDLINANKSSALIEKAVNLNLHNEVYRRQKIYVLLTIAKIYQEQNNNDLVTSYQNQALSEALELVKISPQSSLNYYFLALVYAQMANSEPKFIPLAINYMKKAIELDPKSPIQYNNLGLIYLEFKDYKNAEQSFKKAIGLKDNLAESYYHLGEAQKQQAKFNEAIKTYQEVFKFEPDNQFARNEIEKITNYSR